MDFRTVMAILILIVVNSCAPSQSKHDVNKVTGKTGLRINNSPTRGLGYTDEVGRKYGLVYINSSIANDTVIPIHVQIEFSNEYDYPVDFGDKQYKILLWPNEWTQEESPLSEWIKQTSQNALYERLAPGAEYCFTIGILRPVRTGLCSATPYGIFNYTGIANLTDCDWVPKKDYDSGIDFLTLGLQVGFCTVGEFYERCEVISCGRINYAES